MSRQPLCAGPSMALAVALALAACCALHADGISRVVEYHSPIDDSVQAYGVYVPSSPPPSDAGYPAVLHGHGYGWRVSSSFSSFQRTWADEHGWVMIHLNARGPNFYEGVGDVETVRVVEDAAARFGLDRDRIYMTGGSMGGTGALRHGLRHPDVFAAVMGVDGWTDFRLWHKHWYARKDARELIEEFRRPLLQAASPLYWAERGAWGAIGHIVDGSDTTVWPENGLRLRERLLELSSADPGAYEHAIIFNPEKGHGGGTDYRAIYGFFVGRERTVTPAGFHVQTTVPWHGELYWGRIEELLIDGLSGSLQARGRDDLVVAKTENLAAFTLHLRAGPVADAASVRVYADGLPCYEGPPATVTVEADLDPSGTVVGWHSRPPLPDLHKRPDLSGPVGHAFLSPFVVAWGTAGEPGEVARHRFEAEQFARSWNDFMVHGAGVEAVPEDRLQPADLATHTVVLFGALDSSSLLRRADALQRFPVRVRNDGVVVDDPLHGPRRYMGEKYGALMCYPNPLTDNRTYLVIANRRWFTQPDGGSPQCLGYDLEKLPWAYPDYLVFNNDQSELPHVLNCNNKPPVTCYEAGYFVEAGFFSDRWQLDRGHQLRRVRRREPEEHRFAHIASLRPEGGEEPRAVVRITDAGGTAVHTARVTGRWWGGRESVASASTDEEGVARLAAPPGAGDHATFEVVNVIATGCTYDWTADARRCIALHWGSRRQIQVECITDRPAVRPDDALTIELAVHNNLDRARRARVRLLAPTGRVLPPDEELSLRAAERRTVAFTWRPDGREPGPALLRAEVTSTGDDTSASASAPVPVTVLAPRGQPIAITEVKAADIDLGEPWTVTAKVCSHASEGPVTVRLHCGVLEAGRFPAAKSVQVEPEQTQSVEWLGDSDLDRGEYTVQVTAEGTFGATKTAEFAVR